MSRINGQPVAFDPVQPFERDTIAEVRAAQGTKPGFFQAVGDAASTEWVVPWMLRQAERAGHAPDPSFSLKDDDAWKALTDGLPEDTWDAFGSAISMQHAMVIRDQMLEVTEARQRLAQLGWGGTGLKIAAAIFDPVQIVAGLATGGLSHVAKGGRAARAVRTGLVVGGTEATIEGYLASQDPDRDMYDVLWAGLGGAALGGGAEALADIGRAARKARQDIEYGELRRGSMGAATDPRRTEGDREFLIQVDRDRKAKVRDGTAEPWEMTRDEWIKMGPPSRPLPGRSAEDRELLRDAVDNQDKYLFHGTASEEAARGIEESGLEAGGFAADWRASSEYAESPDGFILVFRRSDIPDEVAKAGLNDVSINDLYTPVRPVGVFRQSEFGGHIPFGARAQESGFINEPADIAHYDEVVSAINRGLPVPREVRASHGLPTEPDVVALTNDGRMYFKDQATYAERGAFIDDIIQRSGFDPVEDADQIAELRNLPPDEALNRFHVPKGAGVVGDSPVQAVPEGAAVNLNTPEGAPPPFEPTYKAGDFDGKGFTSARAALANVRYSFSSILGRTDSDDLAMAGNMYVTDTLVKKGGVASREGADTWKSRNMKATIAERARVKNEAFRAWAREKQVNPAFNLEAAEAFEREVARAIRHKPGRYTQNKHVNAVADAQRRLQEEIRQFGVRHAVPGFDKFDGRDTYLTRAWAPHLVSNAVKVHGDEAMDTFFFNAVMSEVDPAAKNAIDEIKARKIGAGLRRRLTDMDRWTDTDRTLNLSGDKSDMIEEVLKEAGIDGETIQDVLYGLRKPGDDSGNISVAKHRVQLDERYAEHMADGSTLRMDDLLDNNAERLYQRYANQVLGASAATSIYRQFGVKNWDALKKKLGESMDAQGISKAEIDKKLRVLELADKHVRGIPLEQSPEAAAWARRLMGINYTIMSGGFGIAQIPELAGAIASAGFTTMVQQMPEMRKVILGVKDGTVTGSQLSDFAEAVAGHGSEHFTNTFTRRFADEIDPNMAQVNAFDQRLHQINRIASKVSGLEWIDSRSRRIAGMLGAQKLVNIALGRPLSAKRLASLGLSPEDGERLTRAIRAEHAAQRGIITREGVSGRSVRDIRIDQWEDQGAASMFVSAFDQWSRRSIQTNSLGSSNPWLTQWQGKMLTQFRSFMIQSWEKQFLHRVQMHDVEAFGSAMATMFTAGVVYIAQQEALAAGRPDREKYLDERLSTKAIAAAAFQRAGWTSFVPTMVDTSLNLAQRDPIFQYGNTGLSRNLLSLDSNATSATLNQALRFVGGGIGAATSGDEEFGQQDLRSGLMLAPLSRALGIRNVLEAVAQQLPEE